MRDTGIGSRAAACGLVRAGSAIRLALTDSTELPVTTRTGGLLTLGTAAPAGTTGSHGWYL
jgi:hypothetical protein